MSTVRHRFNHYEVLGVTPGAASDEIARAFARQRSVLRPHAFGGLAEICMAYETLKDPVRRKAYDASIGIKPEPDPPNPAMDWREPHPVLGRGAVKSPPPPAQPDLPAFLIKGKTPESPAAPSSATTASVAQGVHSARPPASQQDSTLALPLRRGPDPKPKPEFHINRGASSRPAFEGGPAGDVRPIDGRRTAISLGAVVVAACTVGGLAGWWATSDVGETPQPTNAVSVPLARPRGTVAKLEVAPAPVPAVQEARRARPKPVVSPAERAPAVPIVAETAAAEEQPQDSLAAPAADEAPTLSTASSVMPLPNGVIARTIERIGYSCGQVVSTTPVESGAAGVYNVSCSSGQSYRASPVNGRYRFRRLGRR